MRLTFIFFLFTLTTFAQGLPIDEAADQRYAAQPRQSDYNDGGKSGEKALEGITKWSLKPYCPTPKNQGNIGSCVGWSVGYAALSIQQAVLNNWRGQTDMITERAFSPMFIYNQIKISDCKSGSFIDSALVVLQNKGELYSKVFDNSFTNCNVLPSPENLAQAADNRILDFMTLFKIDAAKRIKINKTKLSLIQNRPVVIGMNLRRNFGQIPEGIEYWNPHVGDKSRYGGHAMCVIGFDDSKEAFEIMNSWGTEWGNDGFIWVKYDDYAQFCKYGYIMSPEEKIKREKRYSGKFAWRRFEALLTNGLPIFSNEEVKLSKGIYTLKDKKVEVGTIFQMLVSQVTANTYLYVIGIEPDNKIKQYWPSENESPLITFPEIELFIPAEDSGLQFSKKGVEHLIVLYATQPIPKLKGHLELLGQTEGNIAQKLEETFGNALLPATYRSFDKKEMQFENELSEGYIIPVILQIEVE